MLAVGFFDNLGVTEVAILVGIVIPLLVAVVTKYTASAVVKGVVLAILSTLGTIVAWLTGENAPDSVTLSGILTIGLPVFITAVGTYFGFWKSVAKVNERLLPEAGIG